MRAWRFIRPFARILGPAGKLDVWEIESMGLLAVKIAQICAPERLLLDDVVEFAGNFE